jgi:hypothetical protein
MEECENCGRELIGSSQTELGLCDACEQQSSGLYR